MKRQKGSLDTTIAADVEIKSTVNVTPDRSPIILLAIILACLTGWWVSTVRDAESLSLPYLRVDIAIVCFVCMLPLVMLSSDWLFRVFSHHHVSSDFYRRQYRLPVHSEPRLQNEFLRFRQLRPGEPP